MNFTVPREFEAPGRWRNRYAPDLDKSIVEGSTTCPFVSSTSRSVFWRKPGSLMTLGSVSFSAMSGGMFQYGAKTRYVIVSLKIGVGVSVLPTTTFIAR